MANFSRILTYKIYDKLGVYLGLLDDVISNFSIEKSINGGDSEFKFSLSRKFDDFNENTIIKFNNRVKVYLKDNYNPLGDKLIAYGYIIAYSPFLRGKEEGVEVTCLSAVSKLSNDFYRTGNSLDASELGIDVTSKRADQMMEDIITHYRTIETNSMISNDFSNADSTTDNSGNLLAFDHRFFNMKHLDAIREASKFLPKNKSGGYWFYWRIDTDGKLWVKNLSTTANHSFIIGKHIKEISGDKSILDVVNRVHFWNEKGTSDPHYLKIINNDSTSQSEYDVMAEYLTDSKITYLAAAKLLTASKLEDGKDPKVAIKLTLTEDYDLSSIKPGQTCKILNAKNNPYVIGADTVLLIESIDYSVDSAVLSLSNGHVSFSDIVEEERQRLDKEMTWYGFITQSLTAAQLGPANRTWTTDIIFSATTGVDAYQKVDWTGPAGTDTGTINLPPISGTVSKRVVAAGTTGILTLGLDYYIYLNEDTINTTAPTIVSGTGTIVQRGESLLDASKTWTADQYQGYIVTIGGQTRIIRSNTATVLTIEGQWTIADTTTAYTIKKMYFDVSSNKNTIVSLTNVVFSNVKAVANTASQASIQPMGTNSNLVVDGENQIAKRSITYLNIKANTITANEINTGSISIGAWSGSLDNVADGSTYFRPTANQKNGGGYAFGGLDSNGYVKIPVDSNKLLNPSPGLLPTTGIFIDETGIYGRYGGVTKFSILTASGSAYFAGEIGASSITGDLTTTGLLTFKYGSTSVANIYASATGSMLITGVPTNCNIFITGKGTGVASLSIDATSYFYASGTLTQNVSTKTIIPASLSITLGDTASNWGQLYLDTIGYVTAAGGEGSPFPAATGWSVSKIATGRYTVTHSLNSVFYAVTITPVASAAKVWSIESRDANSFTVRIGNSSWALEDNDFMFILINN